MIRTVRSEVPAAPGKEAVRRKASRWMVITLFGIMSFLSVLICTGIGSVRFSASEVARALFIDDGSMARLIVWNLRFPRVLAGAKAYISMVVMKAPNIDPNGKRRE